MHHWDEVAQRAARACLDYALRRLQYDPVELDHPLSAAELAQRAGATITPQGKSPEEVLRVFVDTLAPACISTDSPRFFAFIPAAPTKAALMFDAVVAASSMNASSWIEASGAVYAENEALRYLADAAGLPAQAGGCFVAGGRVGFSTSRSRSASRRAGRARSWRASCSCTRRRRSRWSTRCSPR